MPLCSGTKKRKSQFLSTYSAVCRNYRYAATSEQQHVQTQRGQLFGTCLLFLILIWHQLSSQLNFPFSGHSSCQTLFPLRSQTARGWILMYVTQYSTYCAWAFVSWCIMYRSQGGVDMSSQLSLCIFLALSKPAFNLGPKTNMCISIT